MTHSSNGSPADWNAIAQRLDLRSIPEPNSGCRLWEGAVHRTGYARIGVGPRAKRRYFSAHRLSYEMANGPIPDGMYVCHRCDVRSCINPDHLFLGTQQDNMDDMVAKGRDRRGERATNVKLTADQVRAIRRDRRPQKDIAAAYGMSQTAISDICRRVNWAGVDDGEG